LKPERPATGNCPPDNPPTEPSTTAPADRREGGTIRFAVCCHCGQRHHEAARCDIRDSLTSSMGNPPDPTETGRRIEPAGDPDDLPLGESPPERELSAAWSGTRKERKP